MSLKNSLKVFDIVFKDRFKQRFWNILLQCFLFTLFLLFTFLFYNVNNYLKKTSSSVVFYAFFKNPITQERLNTIKKAVSNWPEVSSVKLISQNEGLEILKKSLGKEGSILNTLEANPLPYTLEINIKSEYAEKEFLSQVAEKLKKYDNIDWFDSTEKFISPLLQIKKYVSFVFTIGILTVIFLIILTLKATVGVLFFKYRDSLLLLKLLGAKDSFIVFPFIFEGFLEVFVSSSLSSFISFYVTRLVQEELLSLNIDLSLLPIKWYVVLVLIFSSVGALGGFSLKTKKL